MISKSNSKFIKSLQIKKFRQEHNLFLVQGAKNIIELLGSNMKVENLYVTNEFYQESELEKYLSEIEINIIKQDDLEKHSTYKSNRDGLAVVKIPDNLWSESSTDFLIVLDNISDPGNLGTIIRIADWYGIKKIVCSESCVDWYNPKVINSTMGSFTRVSPYYVDLGDFFEKDNRKVIGAVLNGDDLHKSNLKPEGCLLIGSESHGISKELREFVTNPVTIPKFGGAESLNAGIATAIICDNLFRLA